MAWLSEAEFRELYITESATEISSAQVGQCLDEAVDELSTLCGDAAAAEVSDALDDTLLKIKRFRRAQGKLAYRELLFLMSSRFRSGGILSQEKDANSTATDTYESFASIEKRRESLYQDAVNAVSIYFLPAETVVINSPVARSGAVRNRVSF